MITRLLRRVVAQLTVAALLSGSAALAQTAVLDPAVVALRAEADRQVSAKDWTALVETLGRLRTIAETSGDAVLEAETSRRLGLAHQTLNAHDAARTAFERALAIHVRRGDRLSAGQLHSDLGFLAWTTGDPPGIRINYGAAADDFAAAGRTERQVNSLRNMTIASDMSADESVAIVERAAALVESLDNPKLKGLVRHQLGDMLNVRGDYERAIREIEAAVTILETSGTERELANALTSLGRTYRLHGLADRALAIYARVLVLHERAQDARGIAQTYNAIAIAHELAGRLGDARAAYERAFDVAQKAGLSATFPAVTSSLAWSLVRDGEFQRAVTLLEQLKEQLQSQPATLFSLRHILAMAYRGLGRLDAARTEADGAVEDLTLAGDRDLLAFALNVRALVRRDLKDVAGATEDVSAALHLLEELRAKAAPLDAMKASFVDQYRDVLDLAIALRRDAGSVAEAFEIAEGGRARAFQDLLATRALAPAATRGATGNELPSAVAVPSARVTEVVDLVRAANTTLLAYWVAEDETTIWAIPPNAAITVVRVPVKASRYAELTRQIWQTSAGPAVNPAIMTATSAKTIDLPSRSGARLTLGGDPRSALRELSTLLIAPIQSALPTSDASLLTIVPHGPLFSVPYAALIGARDKYLIESHRLHYVASASLLRPPATAGTAGRGVLLVADPRPMPMERDAPLPALPGARAEVRALAGLLPREATTVLLGSAATESSVRAASQGRRAVHFATHGIVFDDKPFESFLALSPEAAAGTDGRLTTGEVYGWRLDADVVVLSGCRTATGQLSGDGVQGLARAFFYAGTPSVVATLWDLPDAPAQHLFPEFYRKWIAGATRSAALRDAQLALIRALRRGAITVMTPLGRVTLPEHPAVWASPVLLGQP